MPEFDHSELPAPYDHHAALNARRASHGLVLNAQNDALRAQAQVDAEQVAAQRYDMQRKTLELNKVKAMADIARQSALIQQQMAAQEHTSRAIEALGSLSPSDPEYSLKMAKTFKDNPMAAQDPVVQAVVKSHLASRHVTETAASNIEETRQKQEIEKARVIAERVDLAKRAADRAQELKDSGMVPYQGTDHDAGGSTTYRSAKSDAASHTPTPDQAGFMGRYKTPVETLTAAIPILKKAGLTVDSTWDTKESPFQKAIDSGTITGAEAGTAAKAIDAFKAASGKQNSYQSHYDEVSAKLGALRPADVPQGTPPPAATSETPARIRMKLDAEGNLVPVQ